MRVGLCCATKLYLLRFGKMIEKSSRPAEGNNCLNMLPG